jgi:hypothetical protein
MVDVDHVAPADVVDHLLWREARRMLGRHATSGLDNRCTWCDDQWPCPPRRLAERADAAARRPWRESWTARHDLNGLRSLPRWRGDAPRGDAWRDQTWRGDSAEVVPQSRRAGNRGVFDQ